MVNIEDTLVSIDADIATYWQDILDLEADYLSTNGKYAQAVSTHNTLPMDGVGLAPENLTDSPTDQNEDWDNLVTLPATMKASLTLDVYQTANTWGWVAIFEATINGVLWTKSIDQGSWGRDRVWYADDRAAMDTLVASAEACWTMNETSGTRYDTFGINHLTDYNTVGYTANAIQGNAATFDPDNDEYLKFTTDIFGTDTSFTLCGWFYIDTTVYGDKNQKIMQFLSGSSERGYIEWYVGSPNKIKNKLFNKEEKNITTVDAEPDEWHFVEYYYDSVNGSIGGSLDNKDRFEALGVTFTESSIDSMVLGALKTGSDPSVRLDQWCLFNKLLTRTELNFLYNEGEGREPS